MSALIKAPRGFWLLLFAVLLGIPSLPAPHLFAQTHGEHLDVRIIQVPVVVSRRGETVTGLTSDDFELFVNGVRHPITYFDILEFEGLEEGRTSPRHSFEHRRLTLLLFDLVNSSPFELIRTRQSVRELVEHSSADDYFGVAVYDGRSLSYLAPYTGDRTSVLRAVETLRPSRSRDPLALTITYEERVAVAPSEPLPISSASVEGAYSEDLITGLDDFDSTIEAWSQIQIPSVQGAIEADRSAVIQQSTDAWMDAIARAAEDLAPLVGIKQVLLFSTGSSIGNPKSYGIDRVHESFRGAGATLHVIDLAGLRAPVRASTTRLTSDGQTPDILFRTALGTGGRVIHSTGVSSAVRVFSDTRNVTYMLGFRPPDEERSSNEIVVKLKNQARLTNLSYRQGYSNDTVPRTEVSAMMLADAILNDIRHDDVTMTIYTDGKGTVDVGMPSDELLAHCVNGWVKVDVYLYVFDDGGNVVGWKHRKMILDEREARARLEGKELVRRERFALGPGSYVAKAIVSIDRRDLLSFRRKDFVIPPS